MSVIDLFVLLLFDVVELFDFEVSYQWFLVIFRGLCFEWLVIMEFDFVVKLFELFVYVDV